MDPKATPQGTLGQIADNPLVASALGQPVDRNSSADPTASDSASPVLSPSGSPIPQPGTPPGSSISGGASMAQMLMAKGQAVPFKSPHVEKIGDNAAQAIKANPEAAQKPGGWAKALVGGAVDALKGISAVGESLGDVAAVGTVPPGAGGLTGLARTMQARQQRMRQGRQDQQEADKNRVMMAEANTRMVHEQRLIHELDDKAKQSSVDSGLRQIETLRKQASPVPPLAQHLDSDQAAQFLKDKKWDATEHTPIPDGMKTSGVDKDGNPINRITYSIMGVPADVDLDPEKDKEELTFLNKYGPPASGGKWGQDGVQHMTGVQYNLAVQHANDVRAADIALQRGLLNAGIEEKDIRKGAESLRFAETPEMVNALGAAKGDIIAARNQMLRNPGIAGKYPNLDNDIRDWVDAKGGKGSYDKMLEDYQKKIDATNTQFEDRRKELTSADGPKAAGLAEQWRTEMTTAPAEYRSTLQGLITEADAKAKGVMEYQTDLKSREAEAELKASEGDMASVLDMALKYQYDPDKLFSRFKGQKQKAEFLAEMHRQDPNWSEAEYRARFNTTNDYRPQGVGGKAVQALNTFAGHTLDANNLIQGLRNTNVPLLNTPINKMKSEILGSPQIIAYRTAIAAAADNYIDFLLNNHAKHESDDKLAEKLQSTDLAPAAAQALLRQMANTIAIKAGEQNRTYSTTMKQNIPGFIGKKTENAFRTFGIDPQSIFKDEDGVQTKPSIPKPVDGMARVKLPSGSFMDFQQGSDAYKQAIAHGAIAVNQ